MPGAGRCPPSARECLGTLVGDAGEPTVSSSYTLPPIPPFEGIHTVRLRSLLATAALTPALILGGASTASAAEQEKPIDSTITVTLEWVTTIDVVQVVGCVVDSAGAPPALINCLVGR